ncbi:MAG TPA: cold shock domain-containing protein [Beijerinckiaceae bacterium]|nr:cold shock domain-containing protein [Beijerinckiaceae bacterium]
MSRSRDFRGPRRGGRDDFPTGRDDFGQPQGFGWPDSPPPRQPMVASGPTLDAKVKWFNPEKGFGFVELSDGTGDAFLHIRAVEAAGQTDMQPGTRLVVRVAQGQKGPQVTEVLEVDTSTAEPAAPRGPRPGGFGGGGPRGDRMGGDRMGGGGGGYGAPRGAPRFAGPASPEQPGTVKWYNPAKGFGFISVEDGGKDVFVHRSALMRAGMPDLQEGQRVMVSVAEGQKGREVASISPGD